MGEERGTRRSPADRGEEQGKVADELISGCRAGYRGVEKARGGKRAKGRRSESEIRESRAGAFG